MVELKEPRTYIEQINLIKAKGFIVDDVVECLEFLKEANYYRLSAYYLPFKKGKDGFEPGVNFKRIMKIYYFDSEMRSILFQAIEQIEFYLRTQVAYTLAHEFGSVGYLDEDIYTKKHNHAHFKKMIKECIDSNKNTDVVRHHIKKYDGNFPIWVIIEFFSIGMLSHMYSDLNSRTEKDIAYNFNTTVAHLKSWLHCLTNLRNRCAHYSRLYYWTFSSEPKTPRDEYRFDRSLFSQIIMLKHLYRGRKGWKPIADKIFALINSYDEYIDLSHIGFPEDWLKYLY